jgi:trigger factor
MAQITYSATVKKKKLEDEVPAAKGLGKGEGYWIAADEHAFLPGMGDAIIGMNVGDKKEVSVLFRGDFAIRELAGITAIYKIKVTGIRERKLPKLDKAFYERLGVKDKEELETNIEKELERQMEQNMVNEKHSQLFEYLLKKTTMDLPESLVQQHIRGTVQDIARQRMMMGATQEQITEQKDELLELAKKQSEESLKLRYIGLSIAEKENLTVDRNDVDEEIAKMAIRQQKDAQTLRKELIKEDRLETVENQVRFEKAIAFMLENAKIKK